MGSAGMQIFTIVTGLASLLGAVLAWQQRKGASAERKSAQEAAAATKALFRGVNVLRLLSDGVRRCYSADQHLVTQMWREAIIELRELLKLLAQLSSDPTSNGSLSPATWMRMMQQIRELTTGLHRSDKTTHAAVQAAREVVIGTLEALERCATEVSLRIGA